jgi:hypothetical protein
MLANSDISVSPGCMAALSGEEIRKLNPKNNAIIKF